MYKVIFNQYIRERWMYYLVINLNSYTWFWCNNTWNVLGIRKRLGTSLRFLRPRRAPAAKSIGGPRLFWVMNALIYWQWGVNGGSGETVGSITEKFPSRSVSPLESRSLPACLFVNLIAIHREADCRADWSFQLYEKWVNY